MHSTYTKYNAENRLNYFYSLASPLAATCSRIHQYPAQARRREASPKITNAGMGESLTLKENENHNQKAPEDVPNLKQSASGKPPRADKKKEESNSTAPDNRG